MGWRNNPPKKTDPSIGLVSPKRVRFLRVWLLVFEVGSTGSQRHHGQTSQPVATLSAVFPERYPKQVISCMRHGNNQKTCGSWSGNRESRSFMGCPHSSHTTIPVNVQESLYRKILRSALEASGRPTHTGTIQRKFVFQDPPLRFHVSWWEGMWCQFELPTAQALGPQEGPRNWCRGTCCQLPGKKKECEHKSTHP